MNKKIVILSIVGIVIILGGLLTLTKDNKSQDKEITIRYLATPTWVAPYEFASELGYLKEKGIKLEMIGTTFSGPETIMALDSGTAEIGGAATPGTLNAIKGGSKLISLWASMGINKDINGKFYVLENSNIRTPKDIVGKKIAVNTLGAHLDYVVREYLKKNGLSIKDVQLVVIPDTNLEQVLRQGQADVVAVGSWSSTVAGKIEEGGGVRVLFTDYELLGDMAFSIQGFSKEFVKKNPKAVKDFVDAIVKATDWARANPDQAREISKKILSKKGGNPELTKYWKGMDIREHALITNEDVQFWIDRMVESGKLKKGEISLSDVFTNEYNPYYQK